MTGGGAARGGESLGGRPVDEAVGGPSAVTTSQVLAGVGLTIPLHLLQIPMIPFMAIFYIGVSQLVYMAPAIVVAYATKRRGLGHGLVIGAAFTLLLNAACFLVIFGSYDA